MIPLFSLVLLAAPLRVQSAAFSSGRAIPAKYTCQGEDVSPALEWSAGPPKTQSYALIVDDPDAPNGLFVHWVLFDLPASTTSLAQGAGEGTPGDNSFGKRGYGGPCPPHGAPHHYRFHVYALDSMLTSVPAGATADQLRAALTGHVLAEGELSGTFPKMLPR